MEIVFRDHSLGAKDTHLLMGWLLFLSLFSGYLGNVFCLFCFVNRIYTVSHGIKISLPFSFLECLAHYFLQSLAI